DHEPMRRLEGEDARPAALAPIHSAVIDMTANARLEHRPGDFDAKHVVLSWLDPIEFLSKDLECPLDGGCDGDLRPYRRRMGFSFHETSFLLVVPRPPCRSQGLCSRTGRFGRESPACRLG